MNTPYARLLDRYERIALLQSCNHLLSWDQETHLPTKAVSYRAKQRAAFSEEVHNLKTAPEVGDWIEDSPCADRVIAWAPAPRPLGGEGAGESRAKARRGAKKAAVPLEAAFDDESADAEPAAGEEA